MESNKVQKPTQKEIKKVKIESIINKRQEKVDNREIIKK